MELKSWRCWDRLASIRRWRRNPFLAMASLTRTLAQRPHTVAGSILDWVRYPKYVIVYDPADKPLKIIRIFHGARNVARKLKS